MTDTQWTGLAASRGPETPARRTWGDYAVVSLTTHQREINAVARRFAAIGESKERTRQTGNLRAAYRAGELAGLVKMGAGLGALVLWAGWLGRRG